MIAKANKLLQNHKSKRIVESIIITVDALIKVTHKKRVSFRIDFATE